MFYITSHNIDLSKERVHILLLGCELWNPYGCCQRAIMRLYARNHGGVTHFLARQHQEQTETKFIL